MTHANDVLRNWRCTYSQAPQRAATGTTNPPAAKPAPIAVLPVAVPQHLKHSGPTV